MASLRLSIGMAGVLLAAVAVMLDSRWVGWAAVALLGVAVMLRIASRRHAGGRN